MTTELTSTFADEIVTHALVRDVVLPEGAGTMALITLDNQLDHTRPTTFGPAGLLELRDALDALAERAAKGEIQAVGLTGKPFFFAVGADLTGVPKVRTREQARAIAELGHEVFGKLRTLGVPSFAFVNGASLGGGVEAALGCTYRTISSGVPMVGLPECFLGMVPGWGGCWEVPNLIGIAGAIKVILENPLAQNKTLTGPQAAALGLYDVVLEAADFLAESIRWAAGVLTGRVAVNRPEVDRSEETWTAALAGAKMLVDMRTGGRAPAPLRALELLAAARTAAREEGYAAENDALTDLIMSDELRAGLYAFDLTQKRAKKPTGAPDPSAAVPIAKIGVVGAGLMASQLALLFVRRLQVPVVLTDVDQARVDKGVAYIHAELDKLQAKGRLSEDARNRYRALVTGATDKAAFADAGFVVEAVFEEMAIKKQVWREVEAVVTPECILATNTSSLSITEMASELADPTRLVGFHFFNPVAVMPLLEIIRGEQTSDAALATAFALGKQLKKTCVLVKDSPSFIVNRMLGRFMSDIGRLVDEGTPIDVADAGFSGIGPMAPFVLMGLVGPAVALHNGETLAHAFPERFVVPASLERVVAAGKTAYYTVSSTGQMVPDPEIVDLIGAPSEPVVRSADEVREFVLAGLAEEARIMIDDGVVATPMDLDLAMITGTGFQFFNGGLTPLLDRTGIAEKVTGQRFLPPGVADVSSV